MFTAEMYESIKKVEATRKERMATEPRRMTAEEKENLLKAYHPDYREDGFAEIKVGPNKGEKAPKELAELLVAFREGGAQLRAIDIHIGKEACEIAFAVCTLCTLLDGAKSILKGDIEVLVVLCTTAHIAEKLAWEDKEALFLYQSRTCELCLRIRKQRIIEIGIARLVFALVDIVSEVLADIAIEHDAQHILFEVPAVHATSQVVGNAPDGFVELLALLVFDFIGHSC